MDMFKLTELGSQVCLDGLLLYLITKYLPEKDNKLMRELNRMSKSIDRLVTIWVNELKPSNGRKQLELSDKIKGKQDDSDDEDIKS